MMINVCEHVYWSQDKLHSFKNYGLILKNIVKCFLKKVQSPDISIGNVGQLALDLLLANMKVEHLGCIVHPCFLPFVGADPFDPDNKRLESSCEIYECKEQKLVFIQIRSCVFRSKYSEFKNLLLNFIKYFSFKQTVILGSSSSEYFPAEQLQDIPLHYLSTSQFLNKEELKQLNWKEFSLPNAVIIDSRIPGSFVSQDLLQECEKENLSLVALICVCSEGDNYPEALHMVNCINLWLKLKQVKDSEEAWKMPASWKLPYGSSAPPEMY